MLFPIRSRENLEKLEELASLQNQVKDLRRQDTLGAHNYHYNVQKII